MDHWNSIAIRLIAFIHKTMQLETWQNIEYLFIGKHYTSNLITFTNHEDKSDSLMKDLFDYCPNFYFCLWSLLFENT